ncbi:MAG: gephyrin-like molybdotransferase Glp [Betaproteobacteria bacterium]
MLAVEEALAIVLREAQPLGQEQVALEDAVGRVLAQDVHDDADRPPFDRAAMDGYALRAEDVRRVPATLEVVDELRAGQWPQRAIEAGEAVRIMTGAVVPGGASAIQQLERTSPVRGGRRVEILAPVKAGANIARRGSEGRAGEVVLARGRPIDAAAAAVLAAAGCVRPLVALRPLVSVLVTGDEIVDAGQTPEPGQVRNSNGPALVALARQAGAFARFLGVVPDRDEAITAAVEAGFATDVLVVSGGVSAGDYDLVEPALIAAGASFFFTQVAIKPGAPLVFGRRGGTLVFGLPGNPVSSLVTFELFVRPCLLRMQGARVVSRPRVVVELLAPLSNRSGRTNHLPVRVRLQGGRLVADPVRSTGSADVVAHARANALVVLAADRSEAAAGETAEAVLLGGFLEDDGAPP